MCRRKTWLTVTCSTTFFCFSFSSTASWIIFCSFLSSKVRALICSLHSCSSAFSFVNSILRFFFSLSLSSKATKQQEIPQTQLFYIISYSYSVWMYSQRQSRVTRAAKELWIHGRRNHSANTVIQKKPSCIVWRNYVSAKPVMYLTKCGLTSSENLVLESAKVMWPKGHNKHNMQWKHANILWVCSL